MGHLLSFLLFLIISGFAFALHIVSMVWGWGVQPQNFLVIGFTFGTMISINLAGRVADHLIKEISS